jgi:hypothetical protein
VSNLSYMTYLFYGGECADGWWRFLVAALVTHWMAEMLSLRMANMNLALRKISMLFSI